MDSQTLYYFRELAKDLNMHRTAERVFVSQQTISNHIQRLEAELGCTLFERKPALSLTYAGTQVLAFAEEMVRGRKNLQDTLADINSEKQGRLCFAASRLRLESCLPQIVPEFWDKYPQVNLVFRDDTETELENLIRQGTVDIGVSVNVEDETDLTVEDLMDDQMFVCVPDRLLREVLGDAADEVRKNGVTGVEPETIKDLPFSMMNNQMGRSIRRCFDEMGLEPKILMTAPYMQLTASVGLKGNIAFFATQMGISSRIWEYPPDLNIFPLMRGGMPFYHKMYLVRHRKRYLPAYARYFKDLTHRYFSEIEHRKIGRAAVPAASVT